MNEDTDKNWEEKLMNYARELPAERMPSALLEERTVRELRRRGLLRRSRSISTPWLVGSIAASLALFATGVVVGQYMGTRNTANMLASLRQSNTQAAAAQVQQAGSAYVQSLEALNALARQNRGNSQDPQAREVALTALHEAANEIVRLAPNDPVAAKILQGLDQDRKQNQQRTGKPAQRQIVWF